MQVFCIILLHYRHFGIPSSSTQGVTMNKFLTIVGQLRFRGTSVLFRLPQSPIKRNGDPYTYPNRPSCPSPVPVFLLTPSSGGHSTNGNQTEDNIEEMELAEPSGIQSIATCYMIAIPVGLTLV